MGPHRQHKIIFPAGSIRQAAGLTLIEMIMVILIMGILMAVAMPKMTTMREESRDAEIQRTLALLRAGHQSIKHQWRLAGSPGADSNSNVTLNLSGIDVVFIRGGPRTTGDSNHVPAALTFQRSAAQTRLFFLFLDESLVDDVIRKAEDGPGWTMFGANSACAAGTDPRRCWTYREGGEQIARITYVVRTGEFILD